MTILEDGRVECVCVDGRRVTLTPGDGYNLAETADRAVTRVEKKRGWAYMVKAEYTPLRDALAAKPDQKEAA